ncbi:MAG: AraC family transcriptional regulator [Clostridia bacterium]|nr:AraC family transcriptional regulator [Clostridia bacterium]
MGKKISLNDVELKFRFDNLHITVQQVNYGVFHTPITRHRHGKTYYELHLVCGGKGVLISDDEEYPLEKGALYMTGPNVVHEQITDSTSLMEEYCLGFDIKRPKNTPDTEASTALCETHFWIGTDNGECERLFESLSFESLTRRIGFQNNIKNIISSILVLLVRAYTGDAAEYKQSSSVPDDKRAIITDNAFLYDYSSITLASLAQLIGLSERQTQRFLQKQYGKTFSLLKREARLNKAKELLRRGKPIEEAARQTGYEDLRSFKKLINQPEML